MLFIRTPQTSRRRGLRTLAGVSRAVAAIFTLTCSFLARGQAPSSDFFPIGVFAQTSSSFDKWKSRGINTMFQYEGQNNAQGVPTVSMAQWSAAAASKGLYYARLPSANPADDLQEKYLIAWTQPDEPDLDNHNPIPQNLIDRYQNLKAISPSKPVWVNFAGDHITPTGANYKQWVKGGDALGEDWYPFTRGYYNDANKTNNINFIGKALDKLRADSQGAKKSYFAVIESSNQKLQASSRAPTTDEFRGEIWEAIIHGATGIYYFPQQIGGGFQYDATPANLVTEMTTQNARIKSLGAVLNSPFNPSGKSFSASDADLEGSWRVVPDGNYFFVLNQSEFATGTATLNLGGLTGITQLQVVGENRNVSFANGIITDTFNPYEVHVYKAVLGAAGSSVPEPASVGLLGLATAALAIRRPTRQSLK